MINDDSIGKITMYLGNNVKVNLGGPESLPGRLLDVQSDYLTLDTKKDGVVYYPLRHVKSVSINSEDFSRSSRSARYHNESNFLGVVRNLHHKKVKINRGGPESVEGVVSNVFDNHLELTVNNDIIFISIYHIKSISQVGKDGRSTGKNRSGNRSSGNRSSGNRSSGNRSRSRSSRSWGFNSRTSGNRSTSGRTGNRRNTRTTGSVRSSRNDPRTSRVFEALAAAQLVGTDSFMFNDPRGSTGSRSSRRSRSTGSGRTRSSHHNRSHRSSSGRSRSSHRGRSSRSTGSGRSRSSHRRRSSRSTGSGRSRSSHRRRSSRSSGCGCSTGRRRSSRGTGSGRSRSSHRSRSTGSRGRSRRSSHHRSSRSSGRRRTSGQHRSRRRRRRRRTTGNTFNWNGMTVRRGGWIKLN